MDQSAVSKKIVIVEDNPSLSDIYKTRLELIGYTCFLAYNGITALYFIQQEKPDLVLLDLMVPDIAGDQILARMRASDWGKDIPVFIISNLNEADAPAGLRELGIEGYAVKANLANDQIDRIVDGILRPAVQSTPAANVPDNSTVQSPVQQLQVAPEPIDQSPLPTAQPAEQVHTPPPAE